MMSIVSETVHVKNVANLAVLLTKAKALNAIPVNEEINLSYMGEHLEIAKKRLKRVRLAQEHSIEAIDARREVMNRLEAKVRELFAIPKLKFLAEDFIEQLNYLNELELRGYKTVMLSQKLYDHALDYADKINRLSFNSQLNDLLTEFRFRNRNVMMATLAYNLSANLRDKFLYDNEGLITKAQCLKVYLERLVEVESLQYKKIHALQFKLYLS